MSRHQILKHMAEMDIPLWATYFYSQEGQAYTNWEFDVIVGDPEEPGPFYPASTRRQALYLNALKIDAIGWYFSTPTLIECKPNAGLNALGQVQGYREWYRIIFGVRPSGLIVCKRMSRQVQLLCSISDVQVRIVPAADQFTVMQATHQVRPLIKKLSILPAIAAVSA